MNIQCPSTPCGLSNSNALLAAGKFDWFVDMTVQVVCVMLLELLINTASQSHCRPSAGDNKIRTGLLEHLSQSAIRTSLHSVGLMV